MKPKLTLTKRTVSALLTLAVLAALTVVTGTPERAQEESGMKPHYIVIDLGTLGGTHGVAEGISDRGWVVGSANLAGDMSGHAFLWRDRVMTDLGTLGGPNSQEQWPVKDNRGLIVGSAETSETDPFNEDFCAFDFGSGVPPTGLACLGFLWQGGVMTALRTLGGNNSYATGVNNRGQAVGWAENSTRDPNCTPPQVLDFEAVIWGPEPGEIRTLPPLPGDTVTAASGINDREQVVGLSGNCVSPIFSAPGATIQHGVIWQSGTVTDIGTLGGSYVFPIAINSRGQVVGQASPPGDITLHTFLWQKGRMQDLGTLPGDPLSTAFGTNDKGEVVGGSCTDLTFSNCRGFLWQNGVMTDLNALIEPGSTSLYLIFGNDINSRGEIAAYAFDQSNGEFHAALAVPCDEEHANNQECEDAAQGTATVPAETSQSPKVVLPENARRLLQQRLRFGRFGAWPVRPQ